MVVVDFAGAEPEELLPEEPLPEEPLPEEPLLEVLLPELSLAGFCGLLLSLLLADLLALLASARESVR